MLMKIKMHIRIVAVGRLLCLSYQHRINVCTEKYKLMYVEEMVESVFEYRKYKICVKVLVLFTLP